MENSTAYSNDAQTSNAILIADGDGTNREILEKIFSEFYTVIEAENGREAVAEIEKDSKRLCAILLDVQMPEKNGLELLRWLKERALLERIPTFLMAGAAGMDVMREAYALGVADMLQKPVASFVALRRVQSAIELFEARENLSITTKKQPAESLEQANRIIQLNQGMIETLATAIEFRNEESSGHVQRICEFTRLMLQHTEFGEGLRSEEIEDIALASIMHDVGKITIPDFVLLKPGKLTVEEYELMKSHTSRGVAILESVPQLIKNHAFYDYARDIARHHHERWDGRGYPDSLRGDEISPWAQIVSLADVYDALSCKRVYKPAFPRELVVEMICAGQCGMFNPHLLKSFLTIEDRLYELYANLSETQEG